METLSFQKTLFQPTNYSAGIVHNSREWETICVPLYHLSSAPLLPFPPINVLFFALKFTLPACRG